MSSGKTSINANHITSGVVSYLKKTNQLHLLPQIARETQKLTHHQLDPNSAIIESAISLSETQLADLKVNLEGLFGRELKLVPVLAPQVIAGLRIKVGDQIIDQSLNNRINQLVPKE
jgi:F-type H+-transporting ATPase subunit delta